MAARSFTVQLRGVEPLLAQFAVVPVQVVSTAAGVVSTALDRIGARTRALAPVDTGFMRDHVSVLPSADGLSGEVGWLDSVFLDAGLPFYPPYQEYGTSRHAAHPSLTPAFEEERRRFVGDLQTALRAAVADVVAQGGGGRAS